MGRGARLWLLTAALLGAAALPAGGETEAEFDKDFAKLQKFGRSGRWKTVAKKLPELLEEHEGRDYVRLQRDAVVELARYAAFRMKHPQPDPKDVVKGELTSYKPATGKLKIRYNSKQLKSWTKCGPRKNAGCRSAGFRQRDVQTSRPAESQVHPARQGAVGRAQSRHQAP